MSLLLVGSYIFVLGLAFGSFALAMVDRMRSGDDWVKGRSKCDHCGHLLKPKDLIPLFSWLIKRGRCAYCNKRLSNFYPLVELFTGLSFLVSFIFLPYELSGAYMVLFGLWGLGLVIMSGLVVFDLRWYLLPNKLVYPLIMLAFVHRLVMFNVESVAFYDALLTTSASVLVASGVFWLLHRVSAGKWIGDGDYRLGVAIGLYLADPFVAWLSLFLASVFGLAFALYAMAKTKSNKKSQLKIPFGPFLMLGLYFSYLFGADLIDWYSSTFLYL